PSANSAARKRRGHTKSRFGCFSCKKRKIKYDYLMHSILALSGSHLSMFSDDPSCRKALFHRQKAITGLEEAFGRWPPSALEAHIMLATSYLLAAQSMYISDGHLDHILSLRGCALISRLITSNRLEGVFSIYPRLLDGFGLKPKPENFSAVDQLLVRQAFQSIMGFSHHLNAGTDMERALFAQLVETIRPLLIPIQHLESPGPPSTIQTEMNSEPTGDPASCTLVPFLSPLPHRDNPTFLQQFTTANEETSFQNSGVVAEVPADHRPEPGRSFNALVSGFFIPVTSPRDEVLHLYSPSNKLGNIILAHLFAVHFIVSPICALESSFAIPIKGRVEWFERIIDAVEDDREVQWTKYMELPSRILRVVRSYLNQKRSLAFGDIYSILVKDPGVFREGR
ncbi:hypothetical protein DM02DRAFT_476116, partial [Periconia macrospinosa]